MKLPFDLVPETAWGESLRNRMGRSRWDKLRKQILADQGSTCTACGSTTKLHCHELWEYNDRSGIQSLRGFQVVCGMCHLASHFGLAQNLAAQGRVSLDHVVAHALRVNGISLTQFKRYKTEAFRVWRERSARKWQLDLGKWEHLIVEK